MKNNSPSKKKEIISRQKIIFIGGIGTQDEFGGELTKNRLLLDKIHQEGLPCVTIDTYKCNHLFSKKLLVLLRTIFYTFFSTNYRFVISTSSPNAYQLLRLVSLSPFPHPIYYWVIGGLLGYRLKNNTYKHERYRRVKHFFVEGDLMKKQLASMGFYNVTTVPNFKKMQELPQIEKCNDGKTHFLFLSRIQEEKGCTLICECAKELNKKGYNGKYQIDFYGQVKQQYETLFNSYLAENDNLRYCGVLDLNDWANYSLLAKYHFMLFPSFWEGEGFPGVVVDASIAGVPIVASDWHFNKELVIDGYNGIIVKAKDQMSLLQAMESILKGDFDSLGMSRNSQSKSGNYDIAKFNIENMLC